MKTNCVYLRPDRLDLPLDPCCCGRLSSAVITVGGAIWSFNANGGFSAAASDVESVPI